MLGDVSASGEIYLCCFLLGRDLVSCLRITRRPSGYLHCLERHASFFYCERLDAFLDLYLTRLCNTPNYSLVVYYMFRV